MTTTTALHTYWRHDLDATLGCLARIPPAEYEKRLTCFRRAYGRIVELARHPRAHPGIREPFSRVWKRWRRRRPALYPEELRDQIFTEAEIERDVRAVGWGRVASLPLFQPPVPAEADAMLAKYRGRDEFVAWLISHRPLLAEVIPHLQDSDVPRDLLLFVYTFVLVVAREPDKLPAFWRDHRGILDRLMQPLIREPQARIDALNEGQPPTKQVTPPLYEEAERLPASPIHGGLTAISERDDPQSLPSIAPKVPEGVTPLPSLTRAAPNKIEEQPSLPLDRAAPPDIEARNFQAALDLAEAGIPVFPVRVYFENGRWKKKPIIKGWQAVRADPERVRSWWRKYPQALPGIALGQAGLVAMDADRHGGPDGVAAFDKLVADHGGLPIGPMTATAGGGLHYIFKQPQGKPLGNHDGVLHRQGINVRGRNGFIVGIGAVCPDGSMWRTADGSPSLIEGFQNCTIPMIPAWLVDLVRPHKSDKPKKAAKGNAEAADSKPSPGAPLSSPGKSATKREKAYARGALDNIVVELAAMSPNTGRNEMTYRKAFATGTMVVRGWIDRRTVEREMFGACEKNGLVAEGDDVRGAIERGLDDGSRYPQEDIPDRRTRGARQQRDSKKAWKNLFPIEVYHLLRVRPGGEYATKESASDVIAAIERDGHVIENLNRRQIGELLRVTFAEWKAIGAMFGRHASRFMPYDAIQEEVDEHLAAVDEAKKPSRAQAARERRAREKLKREQQPPINDLMAQRCKAMVAYAKRYPGKHRTSDLVSGLKRWDAFKDITKKRLRNVIDELLGSAAAGKLPELAKLLIVAKEPTKNRRFTFTVEYRK
jgi:Bifunctional DNA primase/polymerase, N-terminal